MATQYKRAINILCLMKIFGDCALPVGTSKYCLLLKVRHLQLPNPFAEVWEIFLQSTRIILRMSGFWRYPKRRYTVTVVDESWTKLHHAGKVIVFLYLTISNHCLARSKEATLGCMHIIQIRNSSQYLWHVGNPSTWWGHELQRLGFHQGSSSYHLSLLCMIFNCNMDAVAPIR